MVVVVCGAWVATCSTPCNCSWRQKWNSSSIYGRRQQQQQEQRASAICTSSRRSGGDVAGSSSSSSSTTRATTSTRSSLLWLEPSSHLPLASVFRAHSGFVMTTVAVVASTAIMLSIMSPKSDAVELVASYSKQQQRQQQSSPMESEETLLDVPQTLSSQDGGYCSSSTEEEGCKKKPRIQRPKSRKAESCTIKCVTTCIRGGGGSPGEGPLNIRRPIVVFKEGFRSRQYCLIECSDICNLIGDGDSGP